MIIANRLSSNSGENSSLISTAEKLGIHGMYAVDDLVVEEENSFLLRSGEVGDEIFMYYNEETDEAKRDALVSRVIIDGEYRGLHIKMRGSYSAHQLVSSDSLELELKD
ncbi:MAG: hypothetical protein ACM31E_00070 [Fibrobacterota bacterium]|nr:hypothetical protein [Chitinispirillaceae bacterium]